MQFPPAAAAMAATPPVVNPLEMALMSLNSNPYFIGMMMLLLNLGGRFLGMEVTKEQEKFFQNPWVRRILIFTVLFVATRNVLVALIMTIFVLLFLSFLLNENSQFYLWKAAAPAPVAPNPRANGPAAGGVPGMSPEEMEILRRLSEKQARMSAPPPSASTAPSDPKDEEAQQDLEDIYMMNVMRLRG